MNMKERNDKFTDQGWNKLYTRLEQDGLLAGEKPAFERKDAAIVHEDFRNMDNEPVSLKWLYIAGGLVACVSLVFSLFFHFTADPNPDLITLQNETDAPTLVTTLADGSIVYLSDRARIQFPGQFTGNRRDVNLQGNAFFDIIKNKEKPFYISTPLAVIEVLGTSFDVKSGDDSLFSLSVKSGEVKVTMKGNEDEVYVKAGQRAVIESGRLRTEDYSETSMFDAYFRQIQFKDERLADVVRVINLNSDSTQLEVSPGIAGRILTMTLTNDSPASMAQLISMALNLTIRQEGNTIYMTE